MCSVSYNPNSYRNLFVQIPMGSVSYNPNSCRNLLVQIPMVVRVITIILVGTYLPGSLWVV